MVSKYYLGSFYHRLPLYLTVDNKGVNVNIFVRICNIMKDVIEKFVICFLLEKKCIIISDLGIPLFNESPYDNIIGIRPQPQ